LNLFISIQEQSVPYTVLAKLILQKSNQMYLKSTFYKTDIAKQIYSKSCVIMP